MSNSGKLKVNGVNPVNAAAPFGNWQSFLWALAEDKLDGQSLWNKWGYNSDCDSAAPEIITSWGGALQFLTSGERISIVSTSTADDGNPAGTGVNSIVVYGIDENWDIKIAVYTMDGTTPVVSDADDLWIGINRVAVFLSGSGQTNAGTITVTANTSSYTMAQMPAGEGVTQQMIFYIPKEHIFLTDFLEFNSIKLSGGGQPELIFKGWVYSAVNNTKQEVYRGKMDLQITNDLQLVPNSPFPIGEKSILWFEATTDTDNTQCSGRFSGQLLADI